MLLAFPHESNGALKRPLRTADCVVGAFSGECAAMPDKTMAWFADRARQTGPHWIILIGSGINMYVVNHTFGALRIGIFEINLPATCPCRSPTYLNVIYRYNLS